MSEELNPQSIIDAEHLKLLSLGYKISAGVAALFSLFGLFYIFLGVVMSAAFSQAVKDAANGPPPAMVGLIFGGFGLAAFALMITAAALKFKVAKDISRRKSRTFCMVIAALSCLEIPYGLVLGVFTFMVLGRDSIRDQFGGANNLAASQGR